MVERSGVKVMTHPWILDNNNKLFENNMVVKYYGPDTDFSYVCTVTLTLEI